ncbi:hypothetical protein OC846_003804 [Tilletia horrida]|uniref:Uncharacterized protein n=1 Tax=Tilletia horrida TaxID=155126 RepID=A0AAN6JRP7_9BASI|nr:hypothetical protein OC846_003804 [Tilletia horrida]KAK0565129.1 hypothetical protein OC861_003925 [Tilletia horrida]
MARGDDIQATDSRNKRPRTSRAGPSSSASSRLSHGGATYRVEYHNGPSPVPPQAAGPGLTADDIIGPVNLLRVNGHREPGRYGLIPEETRALFDKDPEQDALLWFSAPPIDGPTQAARHRFTLLRPPVPSLDYLYQRVLQKQQAAESAGPPAQEEVAISEAPQRSKATSKKGKAARKRKAAAADADVKEPPETTADVEAANTLAEEVPALPPPSAEELQQSLLAGLEALRPAQMPKSALSSYEEAINRYLESTEREFFDRFKHPPR